MLNTNSDKPQQPQETLWDEEKKKKRLGEYKLDSVFPRLQHMVTVGQG